MAERLARFDDFLRHSDHPMAVTSHAPELFRATARAAELGPVSVAELTLSPAVVRRTERLIQRSDPELCCVVFPRQGALRVAHAGREAVLSGRDFALYDSSRPLRVGIAGGGTATLVRAHVPRALLPPRARRAQGLLGRPLTGRRGVGALLTQFLGDAMPGAQTVTGTGMTPGGGTGAPDPGDGPDASQEPAPRPSDDTARLGSVAVDLLAATLAHHLDDDTPVPEHFGPGVLLLRIDAFIEERLPEPDLSPGVVAAAHHISVSYLHRLFRTRETTVTELIRRRRLERARRDLGDGRLRDLPIHRIAARWGFRDHASFTRAFRTEYGIPPREHRRQSSV
ncbi:helix-turn-helix domain-containing protein [Streptomyces sp. NPDC098781]|uniref:helix-turn-helix domain-containing protein n=1 Tax=Streptomyces sp. NPDC098781 TaxID=3366097 RepID=UPI00381E48EC